MVPEVPCVGLQGTSLLVIHVIRSTATATLLNVVGVVEVHK